MEAAQAYAVAVEAMDRPALDGRLADGDSRDPVPPPPPRCRRPRRCISDPLCHSESRCSDHPHDTHKHTATSRVHQAHLWLRRSNLQFKLAGTLKTVGDHAGCFATADASLKALAGLAPAGSIATFSGSGSAAALRAELSGLRLSELRKRAKAAGVDPAQLEAVSPQWPQLSSGPLE